MFPNPSLITRIAIGKGIGLIVGLMGLIFLPSFMPEATWMLRFGILFWYITVGAFIGVFGVMTYHPVLRLPMPWWFRSTLIGAWMNFVLTLFVYNDFKAIMAQTFGPGGAISSPFWFVLEGAIIGMIMGFFATRFGGEGRDTIPESDGA